MLLEDIRMFLMLAEIKNYTAAAELLYISQSSLSKRIQKLERAAGVKLFVRTTKSVELSQFGEVYYKYAKQIQTAYEACTRELRDMASCGDSLVIGCIPSILDYDISTLIFRYMSSSGIQCQIKTRESEYLEKSLLGGSCDFAFIRDMDPALPLVSVPFAEDHMQAVVPAEHPLARRERLSVEDLRHENFLLHPEGTRPYQNILALCRRAGFEPNVVYTDSHMQNICSMAASGMGVSLLNERLISKNIPGLRVIPLASPVVSHITLCWFSELDMKPQHKHFLNYFKSRQWNDRPEKFSK